MHGTTRGCGLSPLFVLLLGRGRVNDALGNEGVGKVPKHLRHGLKARSRKLKERRIRRLPVRMNEPRMKGRGAAAGHKPRINDHGATAALSELPCRHGAGKPGAHDQHALRSAAAASLLFLLLFRILPCAPQAPRLSVRLKKTRCTFKRRRRDETGSNPHQTSEPAVDVLGHRDEHIGHGRRLPEGHGGGLRPDEDESRRAAGHHVESRHRRKSRIPGNESEHLRDVLRRLVRHGNEHGVASTGLQRQKPLPHEVEQRLFCRCQQMNGHRIGPAFRPGAFPHQCLSGLKRRRLGWQASSPRRRRLSASYSL